MNEKTVKTVIESLVETIESLKDKVWMLEYEKKQLKEELELFKSMTTEV